MPHARFVDPRRLGGGLVGPAGQHTRGGVVVDTRRALLLEEELWVSTIDGDDDEPELVGIVLAGRVNRTTERVRLLAITDPDGAAAIVAEIEGLFERAGGVFEREYRARLADRREEGR